jgi:hypothetical protein
MSDIERQQARVRELYGDSSLSDAQRERLRVLDAELSAARQQASINLQRAQRHTAASAERERQSERVRVHPANHFGPCPPPGEGWISRAEVEALGAGGLWHLDTDQERPPWWPELPIVPPARVMGAALPSPSPSPARHLHAVE